MRACSLVQCILRTAHASSSWVSLCLFPTQHLLSSRAGTPLFTPPLPDSVTSVHAVSPLLQLPDLSPSAAGQPDLPGSSVPHFPTCHAFSLPQHPMASVTHLAGFPLLKPALMAALSCPALPSLLTPPSPGVLAAVHLSPKKPQVQRPVPFECYKSITMSDLPENQGSLSLSR